MPLSLGSHLARFVLSSEPMLEALGQWAAETNPGFARPLDAHLFRALEEHAHHRLGDHRPQQIAMTVEMLRRDPRTLARADKNHEAGHHMAREQTPSMPPCHVALTFLCRRFLVTRGVDVGLDFDTLSELHHLVKLVECSQMQTFAWATDAHRDTPWNVTELSPRELADRARGPVLPAVADPGIEALADRKLAETHRHWNGSASPLSLWLRLLQTYPAIAAAKARYIRDSGSLGPATMARQLVWLRLARRLRYKLIDRLLDAERAGREPQDAQRDRRQRWRGEVRSLLARMSADSFQHGAQDRGFIPPDAPRPLYLRPDLVGERALLYRLFRWLAQDKHAGDTERAAVHAYLLAQNLVLSSLVQPVEEHLGLARFVDHFSGSRTREAVETDYAERLVQAHRAGKVGWLEVRMSPSGSPADKLHRVEAAMNRRRAAPPDILERLGLAWPEPAGQHEPSVPAVGVIFHFIRRPDPVERPEYRDATTLWRPGRHAGLRDELWNQAHGIIHALEHPRLGAMIVGLDVAGLETDAPNEVFAPAIRYLRAWSSRRDHGLTGGLRGPDRPRDRGLRVTCHAGEDFEHLIGGMRAVDEALEFFAMEPGDRIGHGLALGYGPAQWAEACGGSIRHRAGGWLDDLVWFRGRLLAMGVLRDVLFEVESQIAELAEQVYGRDAPPVELMQRAWRWRMEDPELAWELSRGRTAISLPGSGRAFALASLRARGFDPERSEVTVWQRYARDPEVRSRSRAQISVAVPERWFAAMAQVQEHMLAKLVRLRVAIEINPSSNTSVGFLRNLAEHPVFRWYGPGEQRDDAPFIVVGSDDPGIFATELVHEYAFLARAAMERGASPRAVTRWLEELRQASIDFCFVPGAGAV